MDFHPPEKIETMQELRAQIDRIDAELIERLAFRQRHIDRAAQIKPNEGLPARIEERVNEVLDKVEAAAVQEGFDPATARAMWALMVDAMIAREERVLGVD